MRLAKHTDYALRVLMHLTVNVGRLNTISDVSERYAISHDHLVKVVHALSQAGYIETFRGRSGGMRLSCDAAGVRVGDVVRRMEGGFDLVECQRDDGGRCLITPCCRLKTVLAEAVAAFMRVLDSYSVADLSRNNGALADLLKENAG